MIALLTVALSLFAPGVNPSWQVAFERRGDVWVSDPDGSHQRVVVRKGAFPKWSPDGRKLAFFRGGWVWVVNVETGKERRLFRIGNASLGFPFLDVVYITWDPVMPVLLASMTESHSIDMFDTAMGGRGALQQFFVGVVPEEATSPAWSPSGRWLALARNGDVWIAKRASDRHEFPDNVGGYYEDSRRLAPLATFNDAEIGASGLTPYWVDGLTWAGNQRIVFHYQRQGGTGLSQVGYLDLTPVSDKEQEGHWEKWSGFTYTTHWILDNVYSAAVCPDGKTLSYVGYLGDERPSLYVCDWNGHQAKKLLVDVRNADWRPVVSAKASGRNRPKLVTESNEPPPPGSGNHRPPPAAAWFGVS